MTNPLDDFESRLAAGRPQLAGFERDRLLFSAAQASLKQTIRDRTVSYAVVSSLLSAIACFGIMTFAIKAPTGENNIARLREPVPSQRHNPSDSELQLEFEGRSRGVLTATSWAKWESLEKQVLASASHAREAISVLDEYEAKPFSVRSKVTSF